MTLLAITGATGFVGRQILRALSDAGHEIRSFVRAGRAHRDSSNASNVEVIEVRDIFTEPVGDLTKALSGVDTLIHAAWYAEPGKYLNAAVNVDCLTGTLRLVQAFQLAGGRRFVGIGTCFEYDLRAGDLGLDTPLRPQTLYAACKAAVYQVLAQLLPAADVEYAWCRLFYLFGEGEDSRRLVPYVRERIAAGEVAELTSGTQVRDFLDVREAGTMIAGTALGRRQGAVNVCSGVPVTVRQLAERIADEYGRRDLLRFGARPDNAFDPPRVVGIREDVVQ
jgi:dTDP-6-deoxy-L-talose 4-dehydrogenase (NAD+)